MPETNAEALAKFEEVFSDEAFEVLKQTVLDFLKLNNNAQNASLELKDKTVYLHQHKGDVEIHIIDSKGRDVPDLPRDEDEDEE